MYKHLLSSLLYNQLAYNLFVSEFHPHPITAFSTLLSSLSVITFAYTVSFNPIEKSLNSAVSFNPHHPLLIRKEGRSIAYTHGLSSFAHLIFLLSVSHERRHIVAYAVHIGAYDLVYPHNLHP